MKPTHFRSAILILVVVMLIFSTGCAGGAQGDGSEGQESSGSTSQTPVTSSPTVSAAESELRGFFSVYGHAADEKSKYILVETRDDLVAVCGFAQSAPEKEGYIKYRGNAAEPATLDAYPAGYFEGGYLIAVCLETSENNSTVSCTARREDGTIVIDARCTVPPVRQNTLGAHIWLVPVEGRYAGEQIRIDVTSEELVSSVGQ